MFSTETLSNTPHGISILLGFGTRSQPPDRVHRAADRSAGRGADAAARARLAAVRLRRRHPERPELVPDAARSGATVAGVRLVRDKGVLKHR